MRTRQQILDSSIYRPFRSRPIYIDMSRGQRFGYVFSDRANDIGWLLAHELGHGMFTLKHLNDANYAGKSSLGSIKNLMDYTGSVALGAFQWNVMSNPAVITAFDSDDASKANYKYRCWWTDESNNIITTSNLGYKVRYHLATTDIKDGSVLKLQLFDCDLISDDSDFEGKEVFKEIIINNNKGYLDFELPESWAADLDDEGPHNYRALYWKVISETNAIKLDNVYLDIFFSKRTLYVESEIHSKNHPEIYTFDGQKILLLDLTKLTAEELLTTGLDKLGENKIPAKIVWAITNKLPKVLAPGVKVTSTIMSVANKVGTIYSIANLVDCMRGSISNEYPKDLPLPIINLLSPIVDNSLGWLFNAVDQNVINRAQIVKEQGFEIVRSCVNKGDFNAFNVNYLIYYLPPNIVDDIISGKIRDINKLENSRSQNNQTDIPALIRIENERDNKFNKQRYTIETFFINTKK